MKRVLMLSLFFLVTVSMARISNAALYTIGTATYAGNEYNLIYEGQLGGSGLVWLDYKRTADFWQNQVNWVAALSFSQTQVTIDPKYSTSINWSTGWRLPATNESKVNLYAPWNTETGDGAGFGWGGPDESDRYDYYWGFNFVNSEMGHLYYMSLGNLGYIAKDGTWEPTGWGLGDMGVFQNLVGTVYWSLTQYSLNENEAWRFSFRTGGQNRTDKETYYNAMAVHPGIVSASGVPIPGAVWLLGSGIIGLIGIGRRLEK